MWEFDDTSILWTEYFLILNDKREIKQFHLSVVNNQVYYIKIEILELWLINDNVADYY